MKEVKNGDMIKFNAARITSGNPISGEVVNQSEGWVDIRLHNDIQGINSAWLVGEIKPFRKSLITILS